MKVTSNTSKRDDVMEFCPQTIPEEVIIKQEDILKSSLSASQSEEEDLDWLSEPKNLDWIDELSEEEKAKLVSDALKRAIKTLIKEARKNND